AADLLRPPLERGLRGRLRQLAAGRGRAPARSLVAAPLACVAPGLVGGALGLLALLRLAQAAAALVLAQQIDFREGAVYEAAACLFLALGFGTLPGEYPWLALYRVDMLGVALALAAVVVLDGGVGPRRVALAAMLSGLALLTKQTLFSAALAGALWLWWRGERRLALMFGALVLTLAGGVCAALELTTGAFVENTVLSNVNPLSARTLQHNLSLFAVY